MVNLVQFIHLVSILSYSVANSTFPVTSKNGTYYPVTKQFAVTNRFPTALTVYAVDIADPHFYVELTSPLPLVLTAGATWVRDVRPSMLTMLQSDMAIRFHADDLITLHQVDLVISTNITTFNIPIYCYHGRLVVDISAGEQRISPKAENPLMVH